VRLNVLNIRDVAERQFCCGCGVCAYLSPDEIRMVDTLDYGRRPLLRSAVPRDPRTVDALKVCPGIELAHSFDRRDPNLIRQLVDGWGPVREVWEGYAADPETRFAGSSGGAASALALYCIERLGFHGVLHIAARPDVPYLNYTVLSTTRAEILAATGSRYAPASPCDGLQMIEDAPASCVFIGKPCDVAAVAKARHLRPELDRKLGLTIAIFCAATPSTRGTLELLRKVGVQDPASVVGLRYRGRGWPGQFEVAVKTRDGIERRAMSYVAAWDHLQRYRQWRCSLCPDHTGEFADISVGDPWYRTRGEKELGHSIVLVRTHRGQQVVRGAMNARHLELKRITAEVFDGLSPVQPKVRGMLWGRLLALRLMGAPTPRFCGLPMFRYWLGTLTVKQKLQSLYGTARRVFTKRLWRPHRVQEYVPLASTKQQMTAIGEQHAAAAAAPFGE